LKTAQPPSLNSADRAAPAPASEAPRASAGEGTAARVTLLSVSAVTAPDQSAVAPRLRDQETTERTERSRLPKDTPTGPPPAFEESPLERQARVAFDPPSAEPDPQIPSALNAAAIPGDDDGSETGEETEIVMVEAPAEPPPTPSERAEASFAETRALSTPKEPTTIDVDF
jgi:hypothetical protein